MRRSFSALLIALCACALAFSQSSQTVIYNFGAYPTDGVFPQGGLLLDSAGNIYGTTWGGGANCNYNGDCGTVYELNPTIGGLWNETILYNFCSRGGNCPDGSIPLAGLIMDRAGNLYGTTASGGISGDGTVFRLSPPNGNESWTETVLWNFGGGPNNGNSPGYGKLNMDASGNIYGTTFFGGANNLGIVFELALQGNGNYSFSILHSFSGPDGAYPEYGVAIDNEGNLYGTTVTGGMRSSVCTQGRGGCGVVYKLTLVNGNWAETLLHKFNGTAGAYPFSPISLDEFGNLYGTFADGGEGNCFYGTCGGVFKLTPGSKEYAFYFSGGQAGGDPQGGVLLAPHATAYGTTSDGNNVYMLNGERETVLYTFCSVPNCADGNGPSAGTLIIRDGLLYGNTQQGGLYNMGVIYSVGK